MEEKSSGLERVCGRVFLIIFLLFLPIVWVRYFVLGPKGIIEKEYRGANALPILSVREFAKEDFDRRFEDALIDLMPAGEELKDFALGARNVFYKQLSWITINPNSGYRPIGNQVYTYDNHDYLLWHKSDDSFFKNVSQKAVDAADFYNQIPIREKYVYVVTVDRGVDFDHPQNDLVEKISKYYKDFKVDSLDVPDFETYMRFFMRNDHHWNYEGAYQGYKDVIKLILGEKEPIKQPEQKVVFNYSANGSKSRIGNFYEFDEKFTAYEFNLGSYTSYVNYEKEPYGAQEKYFNDPELRNGIGVITYGEFYGDDYKIVEFDFNQPARKNLLLVGFSDTNAVNCIIASHFNKTFVTDPRKMTKKEFLDLIDDNKIDALLLMPNTGTFADGSLLFKEQE